MAASAPEKIDILKVQFSSSTAVPTHAAPKGSFHINTSGVTTATKLYVASSTTGLWTAITTVTT